MLTAEQQILRRTCIGSSEIAKVCGVDFYHDGPHRVWQAKCGLVREQAPTLDTKLGDAFEAVVSAIYADQVGVELARDPVPTRIHSKHAWIGASIDWIRTNDLIPVECKWIGTPYRAHYFEHAIGLRDVCQICGRCASMHWGREPDSIPDDVRLQCAWQMAVSGAPWMHVARLWIANFSRDFAIYTVERNARLEERLIERGRAFWHDYVLTGEAPPADGTKSSDATNRLLFPSVHGGMQDATAGADELAEQWFHGDAMADEGAAIRDAAADKLRRMIGHAEGIQGATWKATNKTRVDGARVLLVKRKKANGKR